MNLATSTLEAIQADIDQAELNLSQQQITRDFGKKEVQQLFNKYAQQISDYWSPDARAARNLITSFDSQCRAYRGAI